MQEQSSNQIIESIPQRSRSQGGVLSPTLFLLFINDLVSELPKGVKAALYADDLVLWCKEEYASTATYRLQQAANMLQSWAEEWCVSVNKEESSTTLFTLSPKQKAGTIRLGNTPLKEDEEATYLGVTFDKKITWKSHITKAEMKARHKLCENHPANSGQSSESSPPHNHWRDEVNPKQGYGTAYKHPTS